jgi:hypothetical protein
MRTFFTIGLVSILTAGYSQDPSGRPALSMAAYSPGFADPFSQLSNPSILAAINKKTAGIYSEQRFMIKEWKTAIAAAAFPTASGNFGLCINYSGSANYYRFMSAIGYARSFGNSFDAGLQFRYHNAAIPGYNSESGLGYTVSLLFHLNQKFNAGFNFSDDREEDDGFKSGKKLPRKFSAGLGYTVSRLVFITTEITKSKQSPLNISAGIHYAFDEKLFFRTGFGSATQTWLLAGGIRWKQLVFQLIASMHPVLGITPGLQLLIEEKKMIK